MNFKCYDIKKTQLFRHIIMIVKMLKFLINRNINQKVLSTEKINII